MSIYLPEYAGQVIMINGVCYEARAQDTHTPTHTEAEITRVFGSCEACLAWEPSSEIPVEPYSSPEPEPEWTPLDLADTVLLLDTDVGITKDGGNLVSGHDDQSPSACHFAQAVGNNKPLWIGGALNGHDILRWDGTSDYMTGCLFNTLFGDNADGTLYVVFKCDNAGGREEAVFHAVVGNNDISILPKWTDNNAYYSWGDIGAGARAIWNSAVGSWQVGCIVRNGNVTGYVDGVQKAQVGSNNYVSPASAIIIGSFSAGARWFDGDTAYFLMGSTAHDLATRTLVFDYLMTRYGIV